MNVNTHHERIGRAQLVCRAENEAIQASADSLALVGRIPFVCECPDPECSEIVRLSFEAYEAIRQYPRQFFNVSGHEAASIAAGAERVIAVAGDLTVVQKIGLAGDLASGAPDRSI